MAARARQAVPHWTGEDLREKLGISEVMTGSMGQVSQEGWVLSSSYRNTERQHPGSGVKA